TSRLAQRDVARYSGFAAVRQPDQPDLRRAQQRCEIGLRLRSRAVIDNDELPVLKGLCEDRCNCLGEIVLTIEGRQDDRDEWGAGHGSPLPRCLGYGNASRPAGDMLPEVPVVTPRPTERLIARF